MTLANTLSLIRLATVPVLLSAFYVPGANLVTAHLPGRLGAILCFIILTFGVVSDALDGYIARRRGEVTRMGKLLDPFADSLTFVTMFACFSDIGYMGIWMFWLILAREVSMHFFLRPYFQIKGVVLAAKSSGKTKTAVQSTVSLILLAYLALIGGPQPWLSPKVIDVIRQVFYWLMGGVTLLSVFSMGSYLMELKKMNQAERLGATPRQGG